MSNPFATLGSWSLKAIVFLFNITTKTQQYADALSHSGPTVLAAFIAIIYDVIKFFGTVAEAAGDAAKGDIPATAGVIFSPTTLGLIQKLFADFHAGETAVVTAFKSLNLPAPAAPADTPKAS